jgi:hypothetical protein
MKGFFSCGCLTILVAMAIIRTAPAQTSGASPFFNASGDTREVDPATGNDTAGAWTPSVPLGYPAPSSSASDADATPAMKSAPGRSFSKNSLEAKKAFISYSASTKTLTLVIPRSQNMKVSAHVLNGQTISRFSTRKFLTAGTHTIRLDNAALANGIIVFSLEGEGFSLVKRINLAEDR